MLKNHIMFSKFYIWAQKGMDTLIIALQFTHLYLTHILYMMVSLTYEGGGLEIL